METEIQQHGQSQWASNTYQKMIEQKEKDLRTSIMANYSRIKEVEKELAELTLQLQVNVAPPKHALEMLRNKIEKQNEKVSKLRAKHAQAKKAMLAIEEELQHEEAAKDKLCAELGLLVQQSANAQLAKLEELKNHLEHLNRGMALPQVGVSETATAKSPSPSGSTPSSHPEAMSVQSSHTHEANNSHATQMEGQKRDANSTANHSDAGSSVATARLTRQGAQSAPGTPPVVPAAATSERASKAVRGVGIEGARDGSGRAGEDDMTQKALIAEVAAARLRQSAVTDSQRGVEDGSARLPLQRTPAGAPLEPALAQKQSAVAMTPSQPRSARNHRTFVGFDV